MHLPAGGLVGAIFNTLNLGLMWVRVNKLRRPSLKMLEVSISPPLSLSLSFAWQR
jgi:hypothetical protein